MCVGGHHVWGRMEPKNAAAYKHNILVTLYRFTMNSQMCTYYQTWIIPASYAGYSKTCQIALQKSFWTLPIVQMHHFCVYLLPSKLTNGKKLRTCVQFFSATPSWRYLFDYISLFIATLILYRISIPVHYIVIIDMNYILA